MPYSSKIIATVSVYAISIHQNALVVLLTVPTYVIQNAKIGSYVMKTVSIRSQRGIRLPFLTPGLGRTSSTERHAKCCVIGWKFAAIVFCINVLTQQF